MRTEKLNKINIFTLLKNLLVIVATSLFLSGCATQFLTKQEAFPAMYDQKPLSILVAPALNDSTAAEAGEYYAATIAPYLSYGGYYVLPMEITTAMLSREGI